MKNCKKAWLLLATAGALMSPAVPAAAVDDGAALTATLAAQQTVHIVSGTVTDQDGQPVPGAAIMIQGTTTGTVSDADGRYTLSDVPSDATLVCSFVGYTTASVPVNGQSNVNIVLTDDTKFLEDVVVIGYGTQRKGDVTSAVVSVKAEDFTQAPSADAMDLVKGKVAGLNISKGSGDPNATSSIRLRGVISLEGANTPLVLIDGIEGGLNTVAPENIESIDVLKDASAAAIYGTRGANGVILITTKTGKREEEASVTYSFYGTWAKMGKTLDMMDADDIRAGKTSFTDRGYETDWMDAISQTAFTQNHDFNITGGSKKTTYSANFNYRKALGTIIDTWGQDIKLNMDVAHWFFDDILKAHFNIVYRNHRNSAVGLSGGGDANIYLQAVMRNPTEPIYENQDRPEYNDDGTYIQNEERPYYENFGKLYYWNPVGMIKEHKGGYRSNNTRLTGDLTAEPIKGWQTKFLYSRVQGGSHDNGYYTSKYYSLRSESKTGSASHGYGEGMTDLIEITTKYANTFGKHRVEGLVGYSWQRDKNWGFNANNYNFPTDEFEANNLGLGTALKDGKAGMGSYKNDETLIGIFARLSYGWNDRYNVLVSLRHEGSSKFGADEKWGNFPSVSLGWNISNEGFMQGQNVVSNLKLRIGYGCTGVIPGASYQSLTRYGYGSDYYEDGKWKQSLEVASNPNPKLKWEKSKEWNFGLDFGFLKDRITGSIDVYNKKTEDMLYWYNVPVPPNLYGQTLANVGEMKNVGVEVLVAGKPFDRQRFKWDTSVTVSHNKNKLVSLSNDLYETANFSEVGGLGQPISQGTHMMEVGTKLGNFFGLKSVGVSENGLWLVEVPGKDGAESTVQEISGDLLADRDAKQVLGNGQPSVYVGWSNNFKYTFNEHHSVDLGFSFNGQFDFQILNENRAFYENNAQAYNKLKSVEKAPYGDRCLSNAQGQTFVSYYLEEGDFMKLTNLTLGYTHTFANQRFVKDIRFYMSGENLATITDYDGLDPELDNGVTDPGIERRDKYPTNKSMTVGLVVNFK